MIISDQKYIYDCFCAGTLSVQSVTEDKRIEWKRITDVLQHDVEYKDQYEITLSNGSQCSTTGDHSLYLEEPDRIKEAFVRDFNIGDPIVFIENGEVAGIPMASLTKIQPEKYMYDLSVEDNHNFVLKSGILAHNTFRPPSSAKFIQGQTQVFGFVWEDEELYEYLLMAIDDFNSRPPTTGITIDNLFASERRWTTTILVRAGAFACFAIALNWIVDEFSLDQNERITVKDEMGNDYSLTVRELFDIMYGDKLEEITKQAKKDVLGAIEELKNESV